MPTNIPFIDFCNHKGYTVAPDARILDFGCGAGAFVYKLIDAGYPNAEGYDVKDRPLELRDPADKSRFYIDPEGHIPVPDETYDFIFSSQVFEHVQDQRAAFIEILRVLKPGGVNVNVFPGNWRIIEPHTMVPLGGIVMFRTRLWFRLWAALGIRNGFQKGMSATEVTDRNHAYVHDSVNYLSLRQYRQVLSDLPMKWSWEEFDYRLAGGGRRAQLGKRFPVILALSRLSIGMGRAMQSRVLVMRKNPTPK